MAGSGSNAEDLIVFAEHGDVAGAAAATKTEIVWRVHPAQRVDLGRRHPRAGLFGMRPYQQPDRERPAHAGVEQEGPAGVVFDMTSRGDSQCHWEYAERMCGWKLAGSVALPVMTTLTAPSLSSSLCQSGRSLMIAA